MRAREQKVAAAVMRESNLAIPRCETRVPFPAVGLCHSTRISALAERVYLRPGDGRRFDFSVASAPVMNRLAAAGLYTAFTHMIASPVPYSGKRGVLTPFLQRMT